MSESKNTSAGAPDHLPDDDLRLALLASKRGDPHGPTRTKIRVITIRNVPDDRRMWTAAIPAVICALVALGVLSAFQHTPTNSAKTSSHSVPARPRDTQAPETGVGFRTTSPSQDAIGSSTLQLARSRRAGSPKVDHHASGDHTFVEYQHPAPPQSGVERQGVAQKRVIVYN
jgi:hypothetical protein